MTRSRTTAARLPQSATRLTQALRQFLGSQASSGLVLMGMAVIALALANSPLGPVCETALDSHFGPLSLLEWVNDGVMVLFFLLVGLEIKRELLAGHLSTWRRRALPSIAAAGGMAVPALIFLALNPGKTAHGWAIPAATDIAFALGVIALLGNRVPGSLRVFLAALAIIDDLGAVIVIALFYTAHLSWPDLGGAGVVVGLLFALNRARVRHLLPYLALGAVLWVLVMRSGIHATLTGPILALAIPLEHAPARSPLHRLERRLNRPVGMLVLPVFALANAGVRLIDLPAGAIGLRLPLGVGLGLLIGKAIGVFASAMIAIRLGLAEMPIRASRLQLAGTAMLCGIGFTMSLFITGLAFPDAPVLQLEAKIGLLAGSLAAGLIGFAMLALAGPRDTAPPP